MELLIRNTFLFKSLFVLYVPEHYLNFKTRLTDIFLLAFVNDHAQSINAVVYLGQDKDEDHKTGRLW